MSSSNSPSDSTLQAIDELDASSEAASDASPNAVPSAAELAASGALDSLFAQIDAGELQLSGSGGLIPERWTPMEERDFDQELNLLYSAKCDAALSGPL